jgi:hypothetical protein
MQNVKAPQDIWRLPLKDDDVQLGIDYACISLWFTYDRMGLQAMGKLGNAMSKIAVGRAVQSALEGELARRGAQFVRDATDYKEEDYWDITTKKGESVDIKSFHVFPDYPGIVREPLTPELIMNSSLGDQWNSFFPMLIPQDQFDDGKDYYVFALLRAPQPKRCPGAGTAARFLVASAFSKDGELNEVYKLVQKQKHARERMKSGETFDLSVSLVDSLFEQNVEITMGYGDKEGKAVSKQFTLSGRKEGRISGLTAFHYVRLHSGCPGRRKANKPEAVLRVTFTNVGDQDPIEWIVMDEAFINAWISGGEVYFVGWIGKKEFQEAIRQYPAYAPNGKYNGNTLDHDKTKRGSMTKASFCYFYPPTFRGGTKNFNYYCLAKDLWRMDDLPNLLR